ncbi:hypothetical protein HMPREF0281_00689 [Corynebacterium ammoniagenes DSM 20306]|uniref:Uncharacterized protein n=1 Tax=Corynebacterium ammoniagenes DSM 20306 TaxID=649754 RepID=A0ABN0AGL5_CORAM|nr:hypothetical protein HMPREF0281_00689 [Corynebacterium ammoniagenes DSM 20306]
MCLREISNRRSLNRIDLCQATYASWVKLPQASTAGLSTLSAST